MAGRVRLAALVRQPARRDSPHPERRAARDRLRSRHADPRAKSHRHPGSGQHRRRHPARRDPLRGQHAQGTRQGLRRPRLDDRARLSGDDCGAGYSLVATRELDARGRRFCRARADRVGRQDPRQRAHQPRLRRGDPSRRRSHGHAARRGIGGVAQNAFRAPRRHVYRARRRGGDALRHAAHRRAGRPAL